MFQAPRQKGSCLLYSLHNPPAHNRACLMEDTQISVDPGHVGSSIFKGKAAHCMKEGRIPAQAGFGAASCFRNSFPPKPVTPFSSYCVCGSGRNRKIGWAHRYLTRDEKGNRLPWPTRLCPAVRGFSAEPSQLLSCIS